VLSVSGNEGDKKNLRAWFFAILQSINSPRRFFLALLLGVLIIIAFILNRQGIFAPESILRLIQFHPFMAPVFFLALFVLMSLLLLPTLPLNLLSGFLWGPYWGTCFSVTGATAGAVCAFLISRYLARDYCTRKFQNPAWSWLQGEIERRGWKVVAFVRLNSLFPSGPLNYYFGLTPVHFHTLAWSTALFFIPPAFLVASIGHWMGWSAFTGSAQNLMQIIVIISAIITLTLLVTVILKKWLQKNSQS
jgi:uncharacterized membrane protein YdjX (TVP38/TMEM64 family)